MGHGEFRRQADGFQCGLFGLRHPVQPKVDPGQVAVGIGILGSLLHRLFEGFRRFFLPAEAEKGHPQVVPRQGVDGTELHGPPEGPDGLFLVLQPGVADAFEIMDFRNVLPYLPGLLEPGKGVSVLLQRGVDRTELQQRLHGTG